MSSEDERVYQKIKNSLTELGGRGTKQEILNKLTHLYGDINIKTFSAHLYSLSVNYKYRTSFSHNKRARNINPNYDFLYKINKNEYEFYDPLKHGKYELKEIDNQVVATKDGVPLEGDLSLLKFVKEKMKMQSNFQPIVIKSLLESDNYQLSLNEIKNRLSQLNFGRKDFEVNQAIISVQKALNKVIKVENDLWSLDEEQFDELEKPMILKICGQEIARWHIEEITKNTFDLFHILPGSREKNFLYLEEFLETNSIGVGWDKVRDVTNLSESELKNEFDRNYSTGFASFSSFMKIKPKDIVVVTKGQEEIVDFGIVVGNYIFKDVVDPSYPHRKDVVWLNQGPISADDLPGKKLAGFMETAGIVREKRDMLIEVLLGKQTMASLYSKITGEYLADVVNDLDMSEIEKIYSVLEKKKNAILYGPPGTGKTFTTTEIMKKYFPINIFIASGAWDSWNYTLENDSFRWSSEDNAQNRMAYDKMKIGDYVLLYQTSTEPIKFQPNCFFGIAKITEKLIGVEPYWPSEKKSNIVTGHLVIKLKKEKIVDNDKETIKFNKNAFKTFAAFNAISDNNNEKEKILEQIKQEWNIELENRSVKQVTFHPSYSYEDFVEGIRPVVIKSDDSSNDDKLSNNTDEKIAYTLEKGIFQKICIDANKDPDNNYLLIIDEINRGNVSKIFGELITLIEDDKRNTHFLHLAYSKEPFTVPKNLYILGTMNTADKSLVQIDTALRRRFAFVELMPNSDLQKLDTKINDKIHLKKLMDKLNDKIRKEFRDKQIGHSYFMKITDMESLQFVFKYEIIPLLQDYFYEDYLKLSEILGDKIISKEKMEVNNDIIDNPDEFIDALGYILGKDDGNNSSGT